MIIGKSCSKEIRFKENPEAKIIFIDKSPILKNLAVDLLVDNYQTHAPSNKIVERTVLRHKKMREY